LYSSQNLTYYGDQIKEDECDTGTHGEQKCIQNFGWKTKSEETLWAGLKWLRREFSGVSCESGNVPSGSLKTVQFRDLLKKPAKRRSISARLRGATT
jgi:hypothetical protein